MRMLSIATALAALSLAGCATPGAGASRAPDLAGQWIYEVPTPDGVTRGALTLTPAAGRRYAGTFSTAGSAEVLPVRSVEHDGVGVRMIVDSPRGAVAFVGGVDAGGDAMNGVVTYQSGAMFPMHVSRR